MPIHDVSKVVDVPALIEAEAYNSMNGILLQKTSDVAGFANVGYIEAGDWLEYKINATQAAQYDIYFRAASTKNASLNINVDGTNVLTQTVLNTNGWQNWETFKNKITLSQGTHTIRLVANTDGFNLNWFQIGGQPLGVNDLNKSAEIFNVFPNPSEGIFNMQTSDEIKQFIVYQPDGKQIAVFADTRQIDLSRFPSGNYFLLAFDKSDKIFASKWLVVK
jgi:hypothetical protein